MESKRFVCSKQKYCITKLEDKNVRALGPRLWNLLNKSAKEITF